MRDGDNEIAKDYSTTPDREIALCASGPIVKQQKKPIQIKIINKATKVSAKSVKVARSMLDDFKNFINGGNVIDLAVRYY